MIKFSCLISTLFIFNFSYSQVQTEKEIKDLLCHKWKPDSIETSGQKIPVPDGLEETFLDLKTDGTLISGDLITEEKGKWHYDHKTKTLTIEKGNDDVLKYRLIKVKENELTLKFAIQEEMSMNIVLKRVD